MTMARFLIVRHAQATPPDDLLLPGPDIPLLPAGEAQALAIANRLRAFDPAAVYASDARRARQTGKIIASTCDVELRLLPDLREIDLGAWGGQTFAALAAADPHVATWFSDPEATTPPGGERASKAAARVLAAFQTLAQTGTETAVIVGHAGSLRLALAQALGMPLAAYWRFSLDFASLSILAWTSDGPIVESLNDTSHFTAEQSRP
jgi:broad specificity phosphatase PhoE